MKVSFVCLLLGLLSIPNTSRAATINVCPSGCDETSVEVAVSVAAPGDTVFVFPGFYNENKIDVYKSITIRGSGMGITTISGVQATSVFEFHNLPPFGTATLEDMSIVGGHSTASSGGGCPGSTHDRPSCRRDQELRDLP